MENPSFSGGSSEHDGIDPAMDGALSAEQTQQVQQMMERSLRQQERKLREEWERVRTDLAGASAVHAVLARIADAPTNLH